MVSRDLYDSGAIEVVDGQGEEFQLTVHARDGATWDHQANATLTFGTGTMFCFATLGEEDLRRLAGELLRAASVIRDYDDNAHSSAVAAPAVAITSAGKPHLTLVSEN